MTVLEKAVGELANALENLETKLEDRLDGQLADREAVEAARRHARAARTHAASAGAGLSAAISDLKTLLAESDTKDKE